MDLKIFLVLLFSLQCFYWLVAKRASKNLKEQDDYFLAGRNVSFFPLMMTFLATQVGGGIILGAANDAYQFGWPVIFYPLGAAFGLMLLGSGFGGRLASFKLTTVAELFEVVYGSKNLRKIASLLSILSLFMILVAQIIASHKFLISLGADNLLLFILFWAIVIMYTAQGGLQAVISTDVVQAAFFSGVFLLCFGWVVYFEPTSTQIEMPRLADVAAVSSKLSGWLLMPLFFMVIEQDMGQRCFAGASPKIVSRASFVAGLCTMIVCIVPIFFGCLAKEMKIQIPEGGSVLMTAIAQTTGPWMTACVSCAILAAIISTATSLINAISSNLLHDFTFPWQKNGSMRSLQAITCLISIGALGFAFYFDNIVDVLIQSYELSVSCLFVPVVMALRKRQGSFMAALLGMSLGAIGFCLFRFYTPFFPKEIASILLSLLGYCCGVLLERYVSLSRHLAID